MFIQNNIELDKIIVDWIVKFSDISIVPKGNRWLFPSITLYGTLSQFKKAHEKNGFPFDVNIFNNIIEREDFLDILNIIKYAYENKLLFHNNSDKDIIKFDGTNDMYSNHQINYSKKKELFTSFKWTIPINCNIFI
jgi:hypothetical protein